MEKSGVFFGEYGRKWAKWQLGLEIGIVGRVIWFVVATSEVATEFEVPFKLREGAFFVFGKIGSRGRVSWGGDRPKRERRLGGGV
jgi:hypothetical protein